MAQLNFDATQFAPSQSFDVIPAGKYKVQVIESEMRPTKDGEGQYLWLEMEVLDGAYQGRRLWDRINLVNKNAQAVEIARRNLSALCHATGKLNVPDSEMLHFIPVMAVVKVRPPREQYEASNEVRGYEAVNGSGLQPSSAKTVVAEAPTVAGSAPWKQKRS